MGIIVVLIQTITIDSVKGIPFNVFLFVLWPLPLEFPTIGTCQICMPHCIHAYITHSLSFQPHNNSLSVHVHMCLSSFTSIQALIHSLLLSDDDDEGSRMLQQTNKQIHMKHFETIFVWVYAYVHSCMCLWISISNKKRWIYQVDQRPSQWVIAE